MTAGLRFCRWDRASRNRNDALDALLMVPCPSNQAAAGAGRAGPNSGQEGIWYSNLSKNQATLSTSGIQILGHTRRLPVRLFRFATDV
jgi:hypothetical protein